MKLVGFTGRMFSVRYPLFAQSYLADFVYLGELGFLIFFAFAFRSDLFRGDLP